MSNQQRIIHADSFSRKGASPSPTSHYQDTHNEANGFSNIIDKGYQTTHPNGITVSHSPPQYSTPNRKSSNSPNDTPIKTNMNSNELAVNKNETSIKNNISASKSESPIEESPSRNTHTSYSSMNSNHSNRHDIVYDSYGRSTPVVLHPIDSSDEEYEDDGDMPPALGKEIYCGFNYLYFIR